MSDHKPSDDAEFSRELAALTDTQAASECAEPDPQPEIRVTVRRQWNDYRTLAVPLSDLWGFHWRQASGGVGQRLPRPFLHARMWCDSIPDGSDFPHSCRHGPPPHAILVCVCKEDNREIFDRLTDLI